MILLLLFITVQPLISQSLKTADSYFDGGAYYSAANMYGKLLNSGNKNAELKSRRGEIMFRIGECYRKMNKTGSAKKWYLQAQGIGYLESDLYYGLGNIQMTERNYADARLSFQKAKDKDPGDRRIESKIVSCDLHGVYEKDNGQYEVRPVENLNTQGSEYGLSFYRDRLIFASTGIQNSKKAISDRTGLPYSDLYMATFDSRLLYGKVQKMESVSDIKANEGAFCYDIRTDQLYCTRCEDDNRDCYIIKLEEKNGKYKETGKLKLGNRGYGIGHPYITEDGGRIYFTSTMPGGYGGADLWYVDRDDNGGYGKPVNLGEKINTAGDEVFPSFIDGILYFASDGHPGLGGLDLFAGYIEDDGSFSAPFNLRAPFNSSRDDFNMVHRQNTNTGLFVSNRNDVGGDDIYMFDNFPPRLIILNGQVFTGDSNEKVKNYTVLVAEGGKRIYERTVNDGAGYFAYIEPDRQYDVRISSPGYSTETQTVSTAGIRNFSEISSNVYLKKDKIEIKTEKPKYGDISVGMNIEMKNIYYEFDKFTLTEPSKRELDEYLIYFRQYPDMVVEISSHTDSRGSSGYNKKLSEYRAQEVVKYFVTNGVNPNRLLWKGYGKEQLLIKNARTEAEHRLNRRTVFKVLTLGSRNRDNMENHYVPAQEASSPADVAGIVDMSGWWILICKSVDNNRMESADVKKAQKITGKPVRIIKGNDGLYRYCIKYSWQDEALQDQISLYKENVVTELFQFK
jgi:outer membrane protein OmpA-like peptidoglycan-associated protein/tetratricopeptide (TPR) repeat protein